MARLNIAIYYGIGVPLSLLLTFGFGIKESGIWIGLGTSTFLVNLRYAILALGSDYNTIVLQIKERTKKNK